MNSQTSWELLNPKPSSNAGLDIHFVSSNDIGYIINSNEILETQDAGISWQKKQNILSGNDLNFYNTIGFIVGNNGYVLKSIDGGISWSQISTGFSGNFNTVNIINETDIIISSSNSIIKSSDGGNTWTSKSIPNSTVNKTFFVTALIGHAACNSGKMLKTIDGGVNWYVTQSSNVTPSNLFTVYFVNQNIGFYTKEYSSMYKTIDGGETWVKVNGISDAIYAFSFLNENVGYVAGEYGVIFKTINGGNTWNWVSPQTGRNDNYSIYGLHFIDNVGYATGARGRIIKTTDGGTTWTQNSPTYNDITKIHFFDSGIGYAQIGNDYFKTLNKGKNWSQIGTANHYSKGSNSYFVNENIGYSIGWGTTSISGDVFKTTNGGISWNKLEILVDEGLSSVFFIDESTGFISGGFNRKKTLKTIDGGVSWQEIINQEFGQIQFLNNQIGYAYRIGYNGGRMYKTIDGGTTWNINFDINESITSFFFTDENNGYFVGDSGLMYKTRNGGATWEKLTVPYLYYTNVKFYSPNVGYITSDYGEMYKTINGGKSWQKLTNMQIKSISIVNKDIYVAGTYGKILKGDISFNPVSILANPVLNKSNKGATLSGNVAANEGQIQNIHFKYSTNYTFDNNISTTPNSVTLNSSTDVSVTLQNLSPNTTYYYKLMGTYNNVDYSSEILSFTTLPDFELTMNNIYTYSSNTAEVSGNIKSNENKISDIEFQYTTNSDFSNFSSLSNNTVVTANTNQNISNNLSNLSPETTYYVRIKAVHVGINIYSEVQSFTTKPLFNIYLYSPLISGNNATISANISALSENITNIVFEFGTQNFENVIPANINNIPVNSANRVSATISNLDPNLTYYYRIKALNGTEVIYSKEKVFNTSGNTIMVSSTPVIGNTSVNLVGLINTNGKYLTNIQFEYGLTESYNTIISGSPNYVYGEGHETYNITSSITGLLPNTTYFYRLKAIYNNNIIYSNKYNFTTNALNIEDNNINKSNILLYPNPTKDVINIAINELKNVSTITLIDNLGKILTRQDNLNQKNNFKIDLSNKSKGLYIIKVQFTDNTIVNKKLILK
ncbi:MAG: YCF48-related protein [Bacteroidota bacterium]